MVKKRQKNIKPAKKGKAQVAMRQLVDKSKAYPLNEALELAKKTSTVKFCLSLECRKFYSMNPADTIFTNNGGNPVQVRPTFRIRFSTVTAFLKSSIWGK